MSQVLPWELTTSNSVVSLQIIFINWNHIIASKKKKTGFKIKYPNKGWYVKTNQSIAQSAGAVEYTDCFSADG